jgi:hypothetical protein
MDVPSYDVQATGYDRRVGLGEDVCRAIAAHVAERVGADRCLEWGCGTGEIGAHLSSMIHYAGFDRSAKMLDVFRQRRPDADLRQLDGNGPWPVEEGSAVVFGSRSLHLLAPSHVAAECRRVARLVLLGRVEREPQGLRDRMRREMHRLLVARGYTPRDGRTRTRGLSALLPFEAPQRVASWTVTFSPQQAIEAWSGKPGLAGIVPEAADKTAILADLAMAFGELDAHQTSREWYTVAEACVKGCP